MPIAVSSGTDALRFAIMACGIEAGDVVVTVPNTFIATTEAISQARAIPEFVDIDEHTYNMSAAHARALFWRSSAFGIMPANSSACEAAGRSQLSFRSISMARWPIWTRF